MPLCHCACSIFIKRKCLHSKIDPNVMQQCNYLCSLDSLFFREVFLFLEFKSIFVGHINFSIQMKAVHIKIQAMGPWNSY